jgi:hypothetical protein
MTVDARFETFRLSPDGAEVVYSGVTEGQGRVEIRQPVADLDVMLMLIAQVLGRALAPHLKAADSHQTQSASVEPAEGGGVVLSLVSHDITRSFQLPAYLAGQAAEQLTAALRRSRLRLASDAT